MHLPPPPEPRELLPPLLACLPTAFISQRPPPALLPLLSPLLRQRISFLSSSNTQSQSDSWLPLLSWSAARGAKLPDIVERMPLEPHPVSGEVEIDDLPPAKFRRLDEETLHAQVRAEQFGILPTYLWCESDEHGQLGPGWRLAELRALEDEEDGTEWFESISEANDAAPTRRTHLPDPTPQQNSRPAYGRIPSSTTNGDDNDDAYWAAYDRTPGRRTPANKLSPLPSSAAQFPPHLQQRGASAASQAEQDYYARYAAEVQPALDSHDPDEESSQTGPSTLNGHTLLPAESAPAALPSTSRMSYYDNDDRPTNHSLYPAAPNPSALQQTNTFPLPAPAPISPSASPSPTTSIEKLEARARAISEADDRAHMAIRQHIATDVKSLYRLARTAGMERGEFERVVRTELECLGLMERDE